jgi:hypothetical protein
MFRGLERWNGCVDLKVDSLQLRLIIVEETRKGLMERGFLKTMLSLDEQLPSEVVLWLLEHGNLLSYATKISRI